MATAKINIKFGQPTQHTSLISFEAQLRKQQIAKHNKSLSQEVKKYNLPFIIIKMPQSAKSFPLPKLFKQLLKEHMFQQQELQANGAFYRMYTFKSALVIGVLSKIEQLFKEISHLNNKLYLHCHLHNLDGLESKIQEKELDLFTTLFDKSSIQGLVDLDGKLIQTIGLLFDKISPKFSESPIIAALELFQDLQIDLQLYSPTILSKRTREVYTKKVFEVDQVDKEQEQQIIKSMIGVKEATTIYVHFKSLGYIKMEFETRLLGYLHYFQHKPTFF